MIVNTKKHRVPIFVSFLVLLVSIITTSTSYASTTSLTTIVPSNYSVDVEIHGKGTLYINGVAYSESTTVYLENGSKIELCQKPQKGYVLSYGYYGKDDITKELKSGSYTVSIHNNNVIKIFFSSESNPSTKTTATGDKESLFLWILIATITTVMLTIIIRRDR